MTSPVGSRSHRTSLRSLRFPAAGSRCANLRLDLADVVLDGARVDPLLCQQSLALLALALQLRFASLALLGFLLCSCLRQLQFLEFAQIGFALCSFALIAFALCGLSLGNLAQFTLALLLRDAILLEAGLLEPFLLDPLFSSVLFLSCLQRMSAFVGSS
jgi:hypothetical protein